MIPLYVACDASSSHIISTIVPVLACRRYSPHRRTITIRVIIRDCEFKRVINRDPLISGSMEGQLRRS